MSLDKVHALLQQEMSRKEFLRFSGVILLSIVGVTSTLNNLRAVQTSTHQVKTGSGYGFSPYGR
jgi:hypothetical protein